jgi:hypothetical protein
MYCEARVTPPGKRLPSHKSDSVLVASGGSASEQISVTLKLVKFGGHVACVSGFFGDEVVTIPLEVWNWPSATSGSPEPSPEPAGTTTIVSSRSSSTASSTLHLSSPTYFTVGAKSTKAST